MNEFAKHFEQNRAIYGKMVENGLISKDDIKMAGNLGGKYSDEDQQNATDRIRNAAKNLHEKNPDHQMVSSFYTSFPSTKFTPNKEDWQSYNNDQMAELAKTMKFNWKNKDDRSKMMKELMEEQIVKDKQKSYQEYKKEHPIAAFINENIIAPNASTRLSRGEDITNKDVALDLANVGTYLVPGAGIAKTGLGKAGMFALDAAAQGAVGAASDVNQGNELGLHNVTMPLIGAGAGAVTDLVPRMGKLAVDVATGGFGGRVGKPIGDVAEGWITKIFGDEVETAKAALAKEAKAAKTAPTMRKNASKESQHAFQSQGIEFKPNAEAKKLAKDKDFYARNPDKWQEKVNTGKIDDPNKYLSDPNFAKVMQQKKLSTPKQIGVDMARGTSRQTGKGIMIAQSNKARKESAKPSIEQVFASPEMAEYIRLKRRGFSPQIPDKFKEYKQQVDAIINDPNLNLR